MDNYSNYKTLEFKEALILLTRSLKLRGEINVLSSVGAKKITAQE
jgi:hypothetical protein